MLKISSREIIDVVRFEDNKAIIVEKKPMFDDMGKYKVGYFVINFESGEKEVITKTAYLRIKFGANYENIISQLGNYVQCDTYIMPNKNVLLLYPGGPAGQFDSDGKLQRDFVVEYNGNQVFGLAEDGDYFWSCCPKENCVIRFYADNIDVDIRVGGKDSSTFSSPSYASADKDYIYVVCDNSRVRKINKHDFTVSDVDKVYSDLCRYYQFGDYSIVCMSDCAYLDKN